jgi:hypothetical protein
LVNPQRDIISAVGIAVCIEQSAVLCYRRQAKTCVDIAASVVSGNSEGSE